MRYLTVLVILVLSSRALPGYGQDGTAGPAEPSPRALEGIDARRAMELADEWGPKVHSVATTEGVTFTFPDGFRRLVANPPGLVMVAVAPYEKETHPCDTHTMSSCQGELAGVPVHVTALLDDGTVLIDRDGATLDNGFVELWLPRDKDVRLTLRVLGYTAEEVVDTRRGSRTCITTMKLGGDGEEDGSRVDDLE